MPVASSHAEKISDEPFAPVPSSAVLGVTPGVVAAFAAISLR